MAWLAQSKATTFQHRRCKCPHLSFARTGSINSRSVGTTKKPSGNSMFNSESLFSRQMIEQNGQFSANCCVFPEATGWHSDYLGPAPWQNTPCPLWSKAPAKTGCGIPGRTGRSRHSLSLAQQSAVSYTVNIIWIIKIVIQLGKSRKSQSPVFDFRFW